MIKYQTNGLFYILLIYILAGCSSEKSGYKKTKDISFTLPFPPKEYNGWGYFYQKDSFYLYTNCFPSYKSCLILNSQGIILDSLNLNFCLPKKENIASLSFLSKDSLAIMGTKSRTLYLYNRKNNILKKIKLDSLFYSKTNFSKTRYSYLELYSFGDFLYNQTLLLVPYISDTTYKIQKNTYETLIYNNHYTSNLPKLFVIKKILDSSTKVCTEPIWIEKTIKSTNQYHNVAPVFYFGNNYIYMHFAYDKHVYLIDTTDLSFVKKIPIFSVYTQLEYPKKQITKTNADSLMEISYEIQYMGMIEKLFYDKIKKKNLVYLTHECPSNQINPKIPKLSKEKRGSIIIYNDLWEKEKEVLIDNNEFFISFLPNGQFVTQSKSKNPRNITLNFYQWAE